MEMKKIPDKSINLVLTDPPYNTGMKASTSGKATRLCHFFDDDYTTTEYISLVENTVKEIYRVLKDDRPIYIFMSIKQIGLWLEKLSGGGAYYKKCYRLG